MTDAQRAYIRKETAIGVAINAVLSAVFAITLFAGRDAIPVADIVLDALPQSFMIALMATLVPTAITRKRLRTGTIAPLTGGAGWLPANLLLRSLFVAATCALAGGAVHWLLLRRLTPGTWAFGPLLAYKTAYGGSLALLLGPFVLRRALADGAPRTA